jgi:HAMP domain-containing protein
MSLRTRLLLALGYLVVLVTIAFALPFALNLRDRTRAEVRSEARSQIGVLAAGSSEAVAKRTLADLDVLATSSGRSARGRVVIVDRVGRVLADSEHSAPVGTLYATAARPELVSTLRGRRVQAERSSETLGEELLVSAEPIFRRGQVVGGVRLTQSVASVNDAVSRTVLGLIAVGLAVLVTALIVAFLLARSIARPIVRLEEAAQRVAAGDLDARAELEGTVEQRSLARSFNAMTERLGRTVRAQREFAADASHQLRRGSRGAGVRARRRAARGRPDRRDRRRAARPQPHRRARYPGRAARPRRDRRDRGPALAPDGGVARARGAVGGQRLDEPGLDRPRRPRTRARRAHRERDPLRRGR